MTQSCPPQPQVSVIVPVYNQERYLEECISSIRRQTLAEWECLIINDGSSDSSGEIARRFSEADSRIRYFEQENGGVSSARNLGMQRASGRYLCFVDGDDLLYGIIRDFLKAHCTDAECRRESLHLPFRLLLKSTSFSDFGRRLRKAGRNTGILWKLLPFCPVPSWRRNGRARLRQIRRQLEDIRGNIPF